VQIVDRTTVPELDQLAGYAESFQATVDSANAHLNPLGLSPGAIAFDISPFDNTAFAALNVGGVAGLYTINLATGTATSIGTIGTGTVINGLAAMLLDHQFAEDRPARSSTPTCCST
jgi:hypothetical protein